MSHIAKEILQDCSTPDEFIFSLRCAECGGIWKSKSVRFSRAGVIPKTEGKRVIFETLYRQEKANALLWAVKEAEDAFSQCPICRRLVCDHCFLICDELDMCVSCAKGLQEPGAPVVGQKHMMR